MLTPRMQSVVDFVPMGTSVADIGCDHAYVAIDLCERGICRRVIAMDVRRGPLEIARANVERAGLTESIAIRLSDGMEQLQPGEVDAVVIAGMGGLLIRDILAAGAQVMAKLRYMVLQPQSELEEVRRYVRANGFEIADEAMVWDKEKPYFAMQCVRQEQVQETWDTAAYRYGKRLLTRQDAGLLTYLQREQQMLWRLEQELQNAQHAENERVKLRRLALAEQMRQNQAALQYYHMC